MGTLLSCTGNFLKEAQRKAAITLAKCNGTVAAGNSSASVSKVRPKRQLGTLNSGSRKEATARVQLQVNAADQEKPISAAGLKMHLSLSL